MAVNYKSYAIAYFLKKRVLKFVSDVFFYSLVVGLCFVILYPLIKTLPLVFNSIGDLGNPDIVWIPIRPSVVSFRAAIRLVYGNGLIMLQTLLYVAVIMVIQVFMSAMSGYALARIKFFGSNLILYLVILTFLIPPQSMLISQYLRFKHFDIFGIMTMLSGGPLDLINKQGTLFILAIFGFGVNQSLFVFIFRQFFKGMPVELEEAAFLDGCGFYRTYFNIMLPNALPAIMTVAVLSFVWNYGDTYLTGYFHPQGPYLANVLTQTFMPARAEFTLKAIGIWYNEPSVNTFAFDAVKQAAALLYLIPLLITYFFAQGKLVENIERVGIVG